MSGDNVTCARAIGIFVYFMKHCFSLVIETQWKFGAMKNVLETQVFRQWALCSWGHVTKSFLKIFYIMGYNLKECQKWKFEVPGIKE